MFFLGPREAVRCHWHLDPCLWVPIPTANKRPSHSLLTAPCVHSHVFGGDFSVLDGPPSVGLKCYPVTGAQEGSEVLTEIVRVSDELCPGEGHSPASQGLSMTEPTAGIRPGVDK